MGGGGVESSFSEKLLSSKQAFQLSVWRSNMDMVVGEEESSHDNDGYDMERRMMIRNLIYSWAQNLTLALSDSSPPWSSIYV